MKKPCCCFLRLAISCKQPSKDSQQPTKEKTKKNENKNKKKKSGHMYSHQQHLLVILHLPSMQIGSTFVVQVPVSNVLRRPHMLLTHAFSSATSQFGPSPELSVSVSLFSVSLFQLRLKCRCLAGSRPRGNIPLPRNGNHSLACWPYGCGWRFENV